MDEQAVDWLVSVQDLGDVGQWLAQAGLGAAGVVSAVAGEGQFGVDPQSAPDVGADGSVVGAPLVPRVKGCVVAPPGDLGLVLFPDGWGGEVDGSGVSQGGAGELGLKGGADGEPVQVCCHEFQGGLEGEGLDGE